MTEPGRLTAAQFMRRYCTTSTRAQLAVTAVTLTIAAVMAACNGLQAGLHGWHAVIAGAGTLTALACLIWGGLGIGAVQRWIEGGWLW